MTVLEFLDAETCRSAQDLFGLARWCSVFGKKTKGPTRRLLYKTKNECLAMLLTRHAHMLRVRGDQDRHRGLLVFALQDDPRRGLHSHEAWLPAA